MWNQLRARTGRGTATVEPLSGIAAEEGILPCSALGCNERTGIACEHVDRRMRLCRTAWCPAHRHIMFDRSFCAIHSAQLAASSKPHPDTVAATVEWFAMAAEDDIVNLMNFRTQRQTAVLEAESLAPTQAGGFMRGWTVRDSEGMTHRVAVEVRPTASDIVRLSTDGNLVRMIVIHPAMLDSDPRRADLDWLFREVVVPTSTAAGRTADADTALTGAPQARPVHVQEMSRR